MATLVAVYFLILVGGVVRSTGSGMGCPDWPKCFGSWIPPASVEQLPDNYKEKYAQYRAKKNEKFARYLSLVGMESTAQQLLSDKSILEEADFNATKTRIEYLNRLTGVLVGLLIIGLVFWSFPIRGTNPVIFWVSVTTLFAVIVQGWFGSIVVSTNLTSWTVTVHMFLALVIVGLIIFLYLGSADFQRLEQATTIRRLALLALACLLVQVFLGTEVRESIDAAAGKLLPRSQWIASSGINFLIHRSFSWLVLIINGLLVWKLVKIRAPKILMTGLIILILGTFSTGTAMGYLDVPAFLQPVHLVLATGVFGELWAILMLTKKPLEKAFMNP